MLQPMRSMELDTTDQLNRTELKNRVIFYLVGIFRTSSLGDGISCHPERMALRRQKGAWCGVGVWKSQVI